MDPGTDVQYLSRHYADAVAAAGGIPVLLPLLEDPESLSSMAGELDGFLLTGSASDIDPASYGAAPDPAVAKARAHTPEETYPAGSQPSARF